MSDEAQPSFLPGHASKTTNLKQYGELSESSFMNSSSMQVISVLCSSSNTTSEELSTHSRSILRNLSGAPAGEERWGDVRWQTKKLLELTIERTAIWVTDRDVVLLSMSSAHSELLEAERTVAAVVDVPDDVGGGGREGGQVAGGAGVEPRDAAGEIYLSPILRVFYNSSSWGRNYHHQY